VSHWALSRSLYFITSEVCLRPSSLFFPHPSALRRWQNIGPPPQACLPHSSSASPNKTFQNGHFPGGSVKKVQIPCGTHILTLESESYSSSLLCDVRQVVLQNGDQVSK
jgi:hypothetical protein